ncbi:hypothetical protein FAES_4362 [Fibrella aestuarina BUZ 2]|uniref:Uncharacterized protein n=1 Tax=Fibrella aestuarina BUZ 2 TaxID=1166018 RepID=I0KE08_9BACT|nr:hypothetical protein [Fibrella aestuarina]CCH02361.1 hypothetical protein FAES_4362 [Fibrella aestuarina BUZ 2]
MDSSANLVYKIYLQSSHPANDEIGYVLAKTGQVVFTEPILMHASSGAKIKTPKASIQPTKVLNPQAAIAP